MVTKKQAAPADAPADDAISFADLASEAAMVDGSVTTTPGAAVAAPVDPTQQAAGELKDVLLIARNIVAPTFGWWPEFGLVWSDAQIASVAAGAAAVMEKHGWTTGDLFAQWGPYIALGVATVPPAIATRQAFQARKESDARRVAEQRRAAQEAAANGNPQ